MRAVVFRGPFFKALSHVCQERFGSAGVECGFFCPAGQIAGKKHLNRACDTKAGPPESIREAGLFRSLFLTGALYETHLSYQTEL